MTVTKVFYNFPFAHRVPGHAGHCKRIHGHNWDFEITFCGSELDLDANGFLVDLGQMKDLKAKLEQHFDHTLVVAEKDPDLGLFRNLSNSDIVRLVVVPSPSCEGLSRYVFGLAVEWLASRGLSPHVHVSSVVAREGMSNSASFP